MVMTHIEELNRREAMSFEKDMRAVVSSRIATHPNLRPEDVVEALKTIAESWDLVRLQVRFFPDGAA